MAASTAPQPSPQDDEQWRVQVRASVLQRPLDCGAEDISCHAYDEQLAETGIEQELRRHPAVAAPEHGGIGLLALGEIPQDFLLHRREPCAAADEARIAFLQTREGLLYVIGRFDIVRRHS